MVGLVGDYPDANPSLVPGDEEHMCCHLIDSDNTLANTFVTFFVSGAVKQDLKKKLVFWTNQHGPLYFCKRLSSHVLVKCRLAVGSSADPIVC